MLHRNAITYAKLPEWYQTSRKKDAKAVISLQVTVPKELEKKTEKFMKRVLKDFDEAFHDFINDLD